MTRNENIFSKNAKHNPSKVPNTFCCFLYQLVGSTDNFPTASRNALENHKGSGNPIQPTTRFNTVNANTNHEHLNLKT